ncbi:hypothetical protein B0H19DRAFT_1367194 [Mycena capillaripes]|nr:hypothetical protein B0H19DRAFT_1384695 [Mycena capillaripes]KAJ6588629.1 hypothetical protein B0H19DRAFT_1367194 [Mycena capillaripes]
MATQVGFFSTPVITANRELDNSRLFLAPNRLLGWSGQRAGHITTGHRDAAHGVHPGHRRYPRARLGDKRARRVVISAHGADVVAFATSTCRSATPSSMCSRSVWRHWTAAWRP